MAVAVFVVSSASPAYAVIGAQVSSKTNDLAEEVKGCIDGTSVLPLEMSRIGFLIPTFTLTPYTNFDHSFYAFYVKYKSAQGSIVTDLNWLRTPVTNDWSSPQHNDEKPLYDFLTSQIAARCGLVSGENLRFIDDVAVDRGALFSGKARQLDVLVMGHEEYVTRAEYNQLKHFVAAGGRLIAMSGNTFWAEVKYDRGTGIETFVAGHGFKFDGTSATRSTFAPFDAESAGWFGSTFAKRVAVLTGALMEKDSRFASAVTSIAGGAIAFTSYAYHHAEANYLRNFTGTTIIARFYVGSYLADGSRHFVMPSQPVDAYAHKYGKGEVVCFCIFGERMISHDRTTQFFLMYAMAEAPQSLAVVAGPRIK